MSTHTTRTGRPVGTPAAGHYITREHLVTGTATQLANLIVNHRAAGTLINITAPRPIDADRFQVVLRLRELQPSPPAVRVTSVGEHARTRARKTRRTRLAVIVTAATGTIAGLLAAAAYLIGQLVQLIATHAGLILGVLALAAILAGLTAGRPSGRKHCPGC